MPVFPILQSKVHILRRFLKILRRRAFARLQLLEALDVMSLCPSQARELHLAITLQVAVGLVGLTDKCQASRYNVIV